MDLPYEIYGIVLSNLSFKDNLRHRLVNQHANQSVLIHYHKIGITSLKDCIASFLNVDMGDQYPAIKIDHLVAFFRKNNPSMTTIIIDKLERYCMYYLIHMNRMKQITIDYRTADRYVDYHLDAYLLHYKRFRIVNAINPDTMEPIGYDNYIPQSYLNDQLIAETADPIIWKAYICKKIKPFIKKVVELEDRSDLYQIIKDKYQIHLEILYNDLIPKKPKDHPNNRMFFKSCLEKGKTDYLKDLAWFELKPQCYFEVRKDSLYFLFGLLKFALDNEIRIGISYPSDFTTDNTLCFLNINGMRTILAFISGAKVDVFSRPLFNHLAIMADHTDYLIGTKLTFNLLKTILYYKKYHLIPEIDDRKPIFHDDLSQLETWIQDLESQNDFISRCIEYRMNLTEWNAIKQGILLNSIQSIWYHMTHGMNRKMKRRLLGEIMNPELAILEKEILDVKKSPDPMTGQLILHLDIPGFEF